MSGGYPDIWGGFLDVSGGYPEMSTATLTRRESTLPCRGLPRHVGSLCHSQMSVTQLDVSYIVEFLLHSRMQV